MVEIKKQVAETSTKKPFQNFKRNQVQTKPPNSISNAESEEEEEEDTSPVSDEEEENEEIVELHGMWDFILPNSDSEVEQEAMPVSTRSKSTAEPIQTAPKRKTQLQVSKTNLLQRKLLNYLLRINHLLLTLLHQQQRL